ncbi:hypothetical protein Mterra_04106 [Calidithermus terrae]|uniref:Uncharacterized protein n=1 Tax=Calidithermus terrae TaxID=1408545 RepID=A0A399DSX9_9DEIN|nr:hypothetical protein Mterra_04106 [Calidithermus terrae]
MAPGDRGRPVGVRGEALGQDRPARPRVTAPQGAERGERHRDRAALLPGAGAARPGPALLRQRPGLRQPEGRAGPGRGLAAGGLPGRRPHLGAQPCLRPDPQGGGGRRLHHRRPVGQGQEPRGSPRGRREVGARVAPAPGRGAGRAGPARHGPLARDRGDHRSPGRRRARRRGPGRRPRSHPGHQVPGDGPAGRHRRRGGRGVRALARAGRPARPGLDQGRLGRQRRPRATRRGL